MAFYGSRGASGDSCYLFDTLVLQVEQGDAGTFYVFQCSECAVQVCLQASVRLSGAALGIYPHSVQVVCLFPTAKIVIILVVSNTVEPGREAGQVAERSQIGVGPYEGFLRQVVAQFAVAASLVQEKRRTADWYFLINWSKALLL